MRLRFDRGTVVLVDPPPDLEPTRLPGMRWDSRVRIHRAPASRHAQIRAALNQQRVQFVDEVSGAEAVPGPFSDIQLRPYQEEALAAWLTAGRRGMVVLPTGSGKTLVAIAAIARVHVPSLCLVPTRALMEQWRRVLGESYVGEVGRFGDGERALRPVTVATYESAWRHMDQIGNRFSLLIVDEAHHFGSGVREEALEMCSAPMRLGLTATPPEEPAALSRLAALLGPVVFHLSIDDLAGDYLASYRIISIQVDLDLEERGLYEGWMNAFRGVHRAFMQRRPGASWDDFVRDAASSDEGRRALAAWRSSRRLVAFCKSKRARLGDLLRHHVGSRVLVFTGENEAAYAVAREHLIMPFTCDIGRSEREAVLAAFRKGDIRALVSSQVLNEGLDVPDADVAIILAGRLGRREHLQRIGRLLRPAPGKRAVVYEVVVRGTVEVRQTARKRAGLAPRGTAPY